MNKFINNSITDKCRLYLYIYTYKYIVHQNQQIEYSGETRVCWYIYTSIGFERWIFVWEFCLLVFASALMRGLREIQEHHAKVSCQRFHLWGWKEDQWVPHTRVLHLSAESRDREILRSFQFSDASKTYAETVWCSYVIIIIIKEH